MLTVVSANKIKRYTVGISKLYFPKEIWPMQLVQEYIDVVQVSALTRVEAARQAWEEHGSKWLSMMNPKQTSRRRISLHVDEPAAGVGGKLGRLDPITVFED